MTAPVITSAVLTDDTLDPGQTTQLTVAVLDPDTVPVYQPGELTLTATDEAGLVSIPPTVVPYQLRVGNRPENVTVAVESDNPAVVVTATATPGVFDVTYTP